MQLKCTVIYSGFVSVCFSGQGAQCNLWKGGNIIPCPGSTTQGIDAQVSKTAGGRFLRIFAATQTLPGSQDPPARTRRAVGDLLLKLLDVTFLTALLPPSPAAHSFSQARWDRCCWGWRITGRHSSSWLSSQLAQDHHFINAHLLCAVPQQRWNMVRKPASSVPLPVLSFQVDQSHKLFYWSSLQEQILRPYRNQYFLKYTNAKRQKSSLSSPALQSLSHVFPTFQKVL